jgi:dipeptidyl aminopeptidase/acylaminoacyl peptidase
MKRLPLLLLFVPFPALAETPTYPDKANLLVLKSDGRDQPITDAAGWAKRRAHVLANMRLVMGPLPDASKKVPLDPKAEGESDQGKYIRYKMTIAVEKGDRLPFYLLVPKKRDGKRSAVMCLHPTSRDLGKGIVVGLGGKADRHYAVELAERGYVALAPDYVNMGEYKFDAYKNGYASATMKGIWNHMRCVDYLQSRDDVNPDRIGAIGHSLGGHNSIFLGVFDDRIKCVVSSCGFCSFPTYMKGNLAGWSHDGYMPRIRTQYELKPEKMPWDFPEAIAALAPRPFLAVAPVHDSNFDLQGVKDCLKAAEPVYKLLGAEGKLKGLYPDAGHDFPDDARNVAYEWLDKWLKP